MLICGLAGVLAGPVFTDEPPAKKEPPPATKKNEQPPPTKEQPGAVQGAGQKLAWLGVGVEPLPEILANQLSAVVPNGQGLLIFRMFKDSPAAKAGLKVNDILVSLDNQKLTSPEEFMRLVRNDKPGQEVTLSYVRGGKAETMKVALGEREAFNPPGFRPPLDEQLREQFEEYESNNAGRGWESFDSLKLTRLDGNRWRAEIEFRDKDGKKQQKTFEGTRHEIRKGIRAEKDLPTEEQHHLLRALNLPNPAFEFRKPPN